MELPPRHSRPGRSRARVLALALALAPLGARAEDGPRPDPASVGTATRTGTEAATPAPAPAPSVPSVASPEAAPSRGATGDLPSLETVIVGRRPRGQVARDPTASATVIEADRFAGEAKGVAELVATAPGVAVSNYGGLGELSTVSIRGSTSDDVLVLVDGLPLNSAAGGGVDLSSIPRHWIERIEVVRGAEGAAYGAGALGGIVNVVTRRGGAPASAEATAGSYGTTSGAATASVGDPGAWALAAASGDSTTGRFGYLFDPQPAIPGSPLAPRVRENNAAARGGLLLKGGLASPARRWDALLSISGVRRELPGSPYHLTPGDEERAARAVASLRVAAPAGGGLTLAARATGRGELLALDQLGVSRERGGAATVELEATQDHRAGVLSARASASGEGLATSGGGDTRRRTTLSAALAEDLRLGPVRLGPAVRADRIGPFDGWSAKLGAGVPLATGLAVRASAGRTYRVPSFSELYLQQGGAIPNPDLRPEQGRSADAAVVADGRWGFASAGGHATLYDDQIFYQSVGNGVLKPFNAGRTLVSGLELEGATAPLGPAGLALEGSYTYLRAEILRGSAAALGNDVPMRPRHRLFVRASATPPGGAGGVHLEVHHVGRQFEDDSNERPVAATTVWNAGAWLRAWRRPLVRLELAVKNLLDERTLQNPVADPLPGRMVLVTVRVESPP